MDQLTKGFLSFFLILILMYLGIGLVTSSIDSRNADSFLEDSVQKMEASNYASNVISSVKSDAQSLGYKLDVESSSQKGDSSRTYTQATLEFNYRMPLIGIDKTQYINRDLH